MNVPDLKKLRTLVLDEKTNTEFYGRFTAGPFERGYGHTIGNSLRRILLSSLEGAAITSVKIIGAVHEFAILKGVKEDVAQIILNLKKIRVKLYSTGPEILFLNVKKAGKVIAGDIDINKNVEIMNPDQEIANIDNGATVEMQLKVSSGKGYVFSEDMKFDKCSISDNAIAIDSLFSPIVKVNYEVENTRVEQTLNYDKLIIEIWTDGTVSPQNALAKSAKILKDSLSIFINNTMISSEVYDFSSKEKNDNEIFKQSINFMNLSTRVLNSLKNANIETVGDLIKLNEIDMMKLDNFGKRSLEEIKNKLDILGLGIKIGVKDDKNI
ncbi:MAG: DNA-directed RNA polymerase subunit alpha [Endomicrobium sp.]|jgi:DNA-directed RNA polymerase subunit alpha|nr:DNA-directed RNA polymerase subunit alpha [Endomicrobium sp.]